MLPKSPNAVPPDSPGYPWSPGSPANQLPAIEPDYMQVDGVSEDSDSPSTSNSGPGLRQSPADGPDSDSQQKGEAEGEALRRDHKRKWQNDSPPADQQEPLASTEPTSKKRRTREAAALENDAEDFFALLVQPDSTSSSSTASTACISSASSASTSSASTASASNVAAPPALSAGWQQAVNAALSEEALGQAVDALKQHNNPQRALALLFGANMAQRPAGQFSIRQMSFASVDIQTLLRACGAVVFDNTSHGHASLMLASDFDASRFRDGMVALQAQELADAVDEPICTIFMVAAEWGDVVLARTLLANGATSDAVDQDAETALMYATASGNIDMVTLLLNHPHDINALDNKGWGALALAAAEGHTALCTLLLDAGASFEVTGEHPPLLEAAANGHAAICTLLVRRGDDIDRTNGTGVPALVLAAANGHLGTCKVLVSLGASLDAKPGSISALGAAAENNHVDILRFFLINKKVDANQTDGDGATALMKACHSGSMAAAIHLLDHGAKIDVRDNDGNMPLLLAAASGHLALVDLLIHHGATLLSKKNWGYAALQMAILHAHLPIVKRLLQAAVPVEPLTFDGNTPPPLLVRAILNFHGEELEEILYLLLQHGASLDRTDEEGDDALMWAAKLKNLSVMLLLIEAGAQIGQTNNKGLNALQIAVAMLDLQLLNTQRWSGDDELPAATLIRLLQSLQQQPDWEVLRKEALNSAQHLLTRELILLDWAWPLELDEQGSVAVLAKNQLQLPALQAFLKDVVQLAPQAFERQHIEFMLGMAGLCAPFIQHLCPYMAALPQITPQLFGNAAPNAAQINTLIAGMTKPLAAGTISTGAAWAPYAEYELVPATLATLRLTANTELMQLGLWTQQWELAGPVTAFQNLFETGISASNPVLNGNTTPQTLLGYQANPGKLAGVLKDQGVFAVFANSLDLAWQAACMQVTVEAVKAASLAPPALPAAPPQQALQQALQQAFQHELQRLIDQSAQQLLLLPNAATVAPDVAQLYSTLMRWQLDLLLHTIQTKKEG